MQEIYGSPPNNEIEKATFWEVHGSEIDKVLGDDLTESTGKAKRVAEIKLGYIEEILQKGQEFLFHTTHVEDLTSVLSGGLLSREYARKMGQEIGPNIDVSIPDEREYVYFSSGKVINNIGPPELRSVIIVDPNIPSQNDDYVSNGRKIKDQVSSKESILGIMISRTGLSENNAYRSLSEDEIRGKARPLIKFMEAHPEVAVPIFLIFNNDKIRSETLEQRLFH